MRCAVYRISDGLVVNVIVSQESDLAPNGCDLIALEDDTPVGIGWTWNGNSFVEPA